jgi:enoyl-CoA hydratase
LTSSDTIVSGEPEVLIEQRGCAGIITLNRPKQLNALSHVMVKIIYPQMLAWRDDASITRIIIRGSGEKAFCAGGDIRVLYDRGKAEQFDEVLPFWREEYALNHLLKFYPKPVVALLNGIVMGGGVGLSIHGSHRVGTERLKFAMPEVGIGFFPDVGASYFLPRLKHHVGAYLATTGAMIGLGDAMDLGLTTHAVESGRINDLVDALTSSDPVDATLARFAIVDLPSAPLSEHYTMIADVFQEQSITAIIALLGQMALGGSLFAAKTLDAMHQKSPMSMAIALRQVNLGASMNFVEVMQMEYRIVSRIIRGHDFYEGVRAVIVDKDNLPNWKPSLINDVTEDIIAAHFLPLVEELMLG